MSEKLQKVLAGAGLGSRREIEQWIQAGRIRINRRVAKLGDRIDLPANVFIDDKPIPFASRLPYKYKRRILIYYKPEGEICTRTDPQNRSTVFSRLPAIREGRWIMVGRLDLNTQGLLLFTNEGELAHRLLHPSYEIEREYAVRVFGKVDAKLLARLQEGIVLEDGRAAFTHIEPCSTGNNRWYRVVLKEGRNREVRRLWESQGVKVSRLLRIRFGTIHLPRDLRPSQWCELKDDAIDTLLNLVNLNKYYTA